MGDCDPGSGARPIVETDRVESRAVDDHDLYPLIGEDGFRRLIAAFYRQVPGDDILGPMYPPDDLAGAERRLRDFLVGRFGGPPRYIEERGHPRLRMRHLPFAITGQARQRWLQLMGRALDEAALPPEAEAMLKAFFENVATMMVNRRQ
jgi:hemoglobin